MKFPRRPGKPSEAIFDLKEAKQCTLCAWHLDCLSRHVPNAEGLELARIAREIREAVARHYHGTAKLEPEVAA